jgi:hypothetical protein
MRWRQDRCGRKIIRGGTRIGEDEGAVSRRWRLDRCRTRVGHLVSLMGSTEGDRLTWALEFENPHRWEGLPCKPSPFETAQPASVVSP